MLIYEQGHHFHTKTMEWVECIYYTHTHTSFAMLKNMAAIFKKSFNIHYSFLALF